MAKKLVVVGESSTQVAKIAAMVPAQMAGIDTNVGFDQSLLPDEFKNIKMEVVQTGFNPSPIWETPGEFVAGIYQGHEEEVGPNKAMLYNFETKNGKPFSIWGCTTLDRAFDSSIKKGDLKPGRVVMVMFVGTTPSKFVDNPTKLFQVGLATIEEK